eukprot:XP_001707494.1 Hypothetical protein GL50803_32673 [Giardia lamblia ATCC 50803]
MVQVEDRRVDALVLEEELVRLTHDPERVLLALAVFLLSSALDDTLRTDQRVRRKADVCRRKDPRVRHVDVDQVVEVHRLAARNMALLHLEKDERTRRGQPAVEDDEVVVLVLVREAVLEELVCESMCDGELEAVRVGVRVPVILVERDPVRAEALEPHNLLDDHCLQPAVLGVLDKAAAEEGLAGPDGSVDDNHARIDARRRDDGCVPRQAQPAKSGQLRVHLEQLLGHVVVEARVADKLGPGLVLGLVVQAHFISWRPPQ